MTFDSSRSISNRKRISLAVIESKFGLVVFKWCHCVASNVKMSKAEIATVNDAYRQFQIILYRWLRFIGLILGQEIFSANSRINFQPVFTSLVNLSLPLLFTLTSHRFDNELGQMASLLVIPGLKVQRMLICNCDSSLIYFSQICRYLLKPYFR